MEEPTKKLRVRFIETTIRQPDYTRAILDLVNGLQSEIEVTSDPEAEADCEVRVVSDPSERPYTSSLDLGTINMDFYRSHGITIPTVYYIAYFLSLTILEYLYLREKQEPFRVYPNTDYDEVNDHVWYGSLPAATEGVEHDLAWPSNDLRRLVDAIGKIRSGSRKLLDEFSKRARHVSNRISRLEFKDPYEPHHHLKDVFIHSDREQVIEVTQLVNSEQHDAIRHLIDLIAHCSRPSAAELLRALAQVDDESVAGYAAMKHEERRVRLEGEKEPTSTLSGGKLKDFEHTVSIPIEISAAKAAVAAVIGNKPPSATSEFDKPVDALGYRSYASALGDLIIHSKTGTPLTMAVCGKWGSGKTTLMDYIKDRINEKTTRSKEFVQIDFNAWEYSKSDAIWAAFYSVVLKQVETGLGWFKRWQFHLYVKWKTSRFWFAAWILLFLVAIVMAISLKQDLSATTGEGPPATNQTMTEIKQAPLPYTYTDRVVAEPESENRSYFSSEFWTTEQIAKLGPGVVVVVTALWNLLVSLSRGILGKVKGGGGDKPLDQESVIKLMERISKWLERNYRTGRSDKWYRMKIPKRFVIYIDDIDRVETNKIMQMMEAIQLFLRTPGFVFVLGMDALVVRKAVGVHYSFMCEADGDGERWGNHYLEKIIQVPFYLPKINLEGMMSLKNNLLGDLVTEAKPEPVTVLPSDGAEPEGTNQPPDHAETPKPPPPTAPVIDEGIDMELSVREDEALDELFHDGLEMTPRLMVRLKNVYLLARHVYLKSGNERVPPVFTKWIALSVRYPFEAKKVVEACTNLDWPDAWGDLSQFCGDDAFGELGGFLEKHIGSPINIEDFVSITNCFNLVLE